MAYLRELVKPYPLVRLATADDNAAILKLLNEIDMSGGELSLRYDRGPDYFAYSRMQGEEHICFLLLDPDGRISGLGTFIRRSCWIRGERSSCVYLGDLRFRPDMNRRTKLAFWDFYGDLLARADEVEDLHNSPYIYTFILGDNTAAKNFFTKERRGVVYHPLGEFRTWATSGRLPIPLASRADDVKELPYDEYAGLYAETQRSRLFGYDFPSEIARRERNWPHLRQHPALLIRDERGQPRTGALPWLCDAHRRMRLERAPAVVRWGLRLGPLLGHRYSRIGEPLSNLYLSHLLLTEKSTEADIVALLDAVYDRGWTRQAANVLVDVPGHFQASRVAKRFFLTDVPTLAYQVIHKTKLGGSTDLALELAAHAPNPDDGRCPWALDAALS